MISAIVLFRFICSKSIVKTKTVADKQQLLVWVHDLEFTPYDCIWFLCAWLWLSGTASVLLLEGFWFDSAGLHVKVSLGKIPNLKLLLMFCTLHGSHCHQCMNVFMNYCKSLWTKVSAKCPKCKCFSWLQETWIKPQQLLRTMLQHCIAFKLQKCFADFWNFTRPSIGVRMNSDSMYHFWLNLSFKLHFTPVRCRDLTVYWPSYFTPVLSELLSDHSLQKKIT